MAAGDLTQDEYAYFGTSRRKLRDQYALGSAQNQYQKDALGNAYNRSQGDMIAKWDQMRTSMPYGYAARGLLNSGIAQRGYSQYATDRNRAFSNAAGQYQDQLGGLNLAQSQLNFVGGTGPGGDYGTAYQDIDAQEAARRQTIAAMLRAAGQ